MNPPFAIKYGVVARGKGETGEFWKTQGVGKKASTYFGYGAEDSFFYENRR